MTERIAHTAPGAVCSRCRCAIRTRSYCWLDLDTGASRCAPACPTETRVPFDRLFSGKEE